jgi:hypothetical protein
LRVSPQERADLLRQRDDLARLGRRRLRLGRARLHGLRVLRELLEIRLEEIAIGLGERLVLVERLFGLIDLLGELIGGGGDFSVVDAPHGRAIGQGKRRVVRIRQASQLLRQAIPLAAPLDLAGLRLDVRVDARALAQQRPGLGAGRIGLVETVLQLLHVVLEVLEGRLDFDFAIRRANGGVLDLPIELILETIARLIDRLDDSDDVLVRQPLVRLSRQANRQHQRARQHPRQVCDLHGVQLSQEPCHERHQQESNGLGLSHDEPWGCHAASRTPRATVRTCRPGSPGARRRSS